MYPRMKWALAGFVAAVLTIFAVIWLAPQSLAAAQPLSAIPQTSGAESSYAQARALPGLPEYRFAEALGPNGGIRQILVYHNGQQVQALDSCTGAPIPPQGEVGRVTTEDYNFDGYPDLTMLASSKDDADTYCIWLFNPQSQTFVLAPELSQIPNPRPDPQTRTIVSRLDQNCSGGCFQQNTYAWQGGQLRLVESVSQDEETQLRPEVDCRYVRTVRREENGRMVEEPRQMIGRGGLPCGPVQRY